MAKGPVANAPVTVAKLLVLLFGSCSSGFGFVAELALSSHNIYQWQQHLFITGQRVSGFAALKAKQFKGNLQRAD